MDTFDRRRSISLVFGILALGLALAAGYVSDWRETARSDAPADARDAT